MDAREYTGANAPAATSTLQTEDRAEAIAWERVANAALGALKVQGLSDESRTDLEEIALGCRQAAGLPDRPLDDLLAQQPVSTDRPAPVPHLTVVPDRDAGR